MFVCASNNIDTSIVMKLAKRMTRVYLMGVLLSVAHGHLVRSMKCGLHPHGQVSDIAPAGPNRLNPSNIPRHLRSSIDLVAAFNSQPKLNLDKHAFYVEAPSIWNEPLLKVYYHYVKISRQLLKIERKYVDEEEERRRTTYLFRNHESHTSQASGTVVLHWCHHVSHSSPMVPAIHTTCQ